jgi:PhnB protein
VRAIPDGFHTVTPYLVVPDAAGLIDFLKEAFDAEEMFRMARPDGGIMHAQVKVGDSVVMMSGASEQCPSMAAGLYLYVEDADRLYQRALAAGATSLMEPMDAFWGDRMGGVKDSSGNCWWIATHVEDVSQEEIAKRAQAEAACGS